MRLGLAQEKPQDPARTATMETRLIRDSAGCPAAIDVWLTSTTDTIQGFEVVLQWDRPNHIQFLRGVAAKGETAPETDSLTALLKPTDPKTQLPISRVHSLVSEWEFVEARSLDGISAKILGVAKLFGQADPTPIVPGDNGALLRIPFTILKRGDVVDSNDVVLNFDAAGTRLSTARGVLFGPLTLTSLAVNPRECQEKSGKSTR